MCVEDYQHHETTSLVGMHVEGCCKMGGDMHDLSTLSESGYKTRISRRRTCGLRVLVVGDGRFGGALDSCGLRWLRLRNDVYLLCVQWYLDREVLEM